MQVLNCFYRCAAAAQEFVWHDATVLFRFARPADESLAALIWCLSSSDPPYTHLLKNIHVIAHCTHDSVPLAGLPATTAWPHGCKKSVCVSPFVRGRSLQKREENRGWLGHTASCCSIEFDRSGIHGSLLLLQHCLPWRFGVARRRRRARGHQ